MSDANIPVAYEKVTIWTRDGLEVTQHLKAKQAKTYQVDDRLIWVGNFVVPRENFRCMAIQPTALAPDAEVVPMKFVDLGYPD